MFTMPISVTIMRICLILVLSTCLTLPGTAFAATYWVSPTGAASWASCSGSTPLSGTAACSRSTANENASGGDTVYFRGGTYTLNSNWAVGIEPKKSGTDSGSGRVIFQAFAGETPIITQSSWINTNYGIYLGGKNYVKIDGFTFQDVKYWAYIVSSSNYNEIVNCTFTSSSSSTEDGFGFTLTGTLCSTHNCWNTHNWIHKNTFSKKRSNNPCAEGVDIIRIGAAYGSGNTVENDNYNTIEDNVFSYAGHTVVDNYGMFNVIRNNVSHNEPWIAGCTNWDQYTSSTSLSIGTGSKTLTTSTGLTLSANAPIAVFYASNYSNIMYGFITSYNSSTGQLVVNVTRSGGSGTYDNWKLSQNNVPYYENSEYNNLFGHRNFQLSDDYARDGTYVLVEGNRLGHASNNPGNGGPMNLDAAAPKNIIRYNFLFNGMASGIYFKYADGAACTTRPGHNGACGGINNRVYNNTVYHNGHGINWRLYGAMNVAYNGRGIAQYNASGTGSTGNVIKNNLLYDNAGGDICDLGLYSDSCAPQTWDTVANNWLTSNGDPKFINPDVTQPTSTTLPNLELQSNSGAIDGGTYLTQANGSGSSSRTLIVDDALYFQDGTWGSDLARGVTLFPDWLAIGTVTNVVQISSIDYSTNTITLASPMSWNDNAPIWLYKKSDGAKVLVGAGPDFGAGEFQSETKDSLMPPTNVRVQ